MTTDAQAPRQSFRRNASYAVSASALTLLVNAALLGVIPHALSVESYGFLQLYLLYSTFVGLAHFGLVDGVYLELGGARLGSVDRPLLTGITRLLVVSQLAMAALVWFASGLWTNTGVERGIWQAVAVCVVLTNIRFLFLYVLQATASAAQAALCIVVDRGVYLVLIVGFAVAGELSLWVAVLCDLIGKGVSLLVGAWFCRTIFTRHALAFGPLLRTVARYSSAGVKLLLANLASTAVIGVARLGIESHWSVREFAFVSLALGIALVGVTVLNSVGMALFPFLRRLEPDKLAARFRTARRALSPLLLLGLAAYIPVGALLQVALPKYTSSVSYLGLILPIVLFEGLVVLLNGQMLRTLRLELPLLLINLGGLGLSAALTLVGSLVLGSIEAVLIGLMVCMAARSIVADLVVARALGRPLTKILWIEVGLVAVFLLEVVVGARHEWLPVISTVAVLGYFLARVPMLRTAVRTRSS